MRSKPLRFVFAPLFLLVAIPAVPSAGGGSEQTADSKAAASPMQGTWTGTTSQEKKIEIFVKDSALDLIKLDWAITFDAPCAPPGEHRTRSTREGKHLARFPYREPVKDLAFKTKFGIGRDLDATLSGAFGTDGSASGDLEIQTIESSPCKGTVKATWKARRR